MSADAYADVLNDGRVARGFIDRHTVQFGDAPELDVPTPQMFLRAALVQGRAFAIGNGNGDGCARLIREDGETVDLTGYCGLTQGNQPVAICDAGGQVLVAVAVRGGGAWLGWFDPARLALLAHDTVSMPPTSQDFADVYPDGSLAFIDPIARQVQGHTVGYVCIRPQANRTMGQEFATGNPVIADDKSLGTLAVGACYEPHLSQNGQWWACRSDGGVLSGQVPAGIPPLVPPALKAIGRPLWMGWFTFGASTLAPGNCIVRAHTGAPISLPSGGSYSVLYVTDQDGHKLYQFIEPSDEGDMALVNEACADAKRRDPHTPTIAYWTAKNFPSQAHPDAPPPESDVAGVECYQRKVGDETIDAFKANRRAAVRRCRRACAIGQAFDTNTSLQTGLRGIAAAVNELVADGLNIEALLWFSDGDRHGIVEGVMRGGYETHPELHADYATIFNGIPSEPPIDVTPAPAPAPEPPPTPVPHPTPSPAPSPSPVPSPAPHPAPSPEEPEMTVIKVGDKGMYRRAGSNDPWTPATVAQCQDAPFVSIRNDASGHIAHFNQSNGSIDGERDEPVGTGEEQAMFDSRGLGLFASHTSSGASEVFEWFGR